VKARVSPNVNVEVDTTNGPGRGQTICDLRGIYLDFPAQENAHCQVPLELENGFAELFTARICGAGEAAVDIN
jgi:purine nucleosidase